MENNECVAVEVMLSDNYSDSHYSGRRALDAYKKWDPSGATIQSQGYSYIYEENMKNIEKHFKNSEVYKNNITKKFNIKGNAEIYYFISLGESGRVANLEKKSIKIIKKYADHNCLPATNILLGIWNNSGEEKFYPTFRRIS